ncbi:hypothetical protein J421_2270 [Gemmatirosa kalamazoonensis]|uniref:HYR domain-containing protein n=1 Tax=Gemmatirosa kalamazoonensis TaxID=861299 RepID=W0RHB0_9BACT|nr:HYR domain-containing protein [Gemmatirosa kalamazoonensis]AHG89807.1 hypothetical protein J421_2270 [Gemmatirosa kalamazoonensis]
MPTTSLPPSRGIRAVALSLLLAAGCHDPTSAPGRLDRPAGRPSTMLTPNPTSVTVAGSFQSELGCAGDWDPACAVTHLTYDAGDDVWQGTWTLPAGSWEYKAALNGAWDENYGLHAQLGGANIPLAVATARSVKFYYDHKSHWITDDVGSVIVSAPGSFQHTLGCAGDWDPGCLRSWLQDPDGDGTYDFSTSAIPAGSYETKAAIGEAWDENYGQGGVRDGANIPFTVHANGDLVTFRYVSSTHVLTVTSGPTDHVAPTIDIALTTPTVAPNVVNATGPSGAVVTYTAVAHDDQPGVGTPSCTPASGTTFAIGVTTIACTVTDAAGNGGSQQRAVTVIGATTQLANLQAAVGALGLDGGLTTALAAKLASTSCGSLKAFANQVRAQRGKAIAAATADRLLAEAARIEAVLGC